ncbi:hypothetical protein MSG28_006420 [Choristoneura fumiferana]|uniref:Uncharacterized protein n=1 Tax=Choristoneura fumiferana TaxID=7141 RepID=A0ACC0JER8_CHOFU|nr:hypothetical protein MSG28_006420 [Choristoneura fumiferana]
MAKVDIKYTKLFINNEWVDAVSKKTFPTINPQDESVIVQVAEGDKADIDLAVQAAKKAFHRYSEWRTLDASQRGRLLLKLADLMDRDAKYLSELETLDNGKPVTQAYGEIIWAAGIVRYYAGKADKILGSTIPADGDVLSFTLKEPVGVCGSILPWNYPVPMFIWKIAPALAAGCTLVVKPAEQTPLTALALAALVKEAGFPAGVVNVVPGYGPTAGGALTHHPDVDKVAFTGSTEVGRIIMNAAAAVNLKRVTLELGGKSPLVIFNDADVDKAADIAHRAAFANAGQCCVAATRTYVQAGIYDKFVAKAAEIAQKRKVGNPYEEVEQGPQIDKEMYDKVMSYIESGKKQARCVAGGNRVGSKGFFIQPTVFADVTDDMKISREEIFGPVQSIHKFDSFEEVVDRANDSNYGLGAGVVTNDVNIALAFIRHLFINNEWVDAVSKKTFPTINPQDESVIVQVAEGDKADVDLAVAAAKKAFHRYSKWRTMDASQRGLLLLKLADLLESQARYLAELETLDCGKPVKQSEEEIYFSATVLRYYAGKADKILGNTIPADGDVLSLTLKEPVGVCGQIIPWNYPVPMLTWKIAPALAAGCTVIVKPAEQTPLTALAVAALIKEAGFPPGVVNVVPGYGPTAGAALTHHPDVDKVAFTGSTEVGRIIMGAATVANLKRVTLELGGKSALVVFNDADGERKESTNIWKLKRHNDTGNFGSLAIKKVTLRNIRERTPNSNEERGSHVNQFYFPVFLCWGILYAEIGEPVGLNGEILSMSLLVIAAYLLGWLWLKITTLPALIGMLLTGILFQNVGLVHMTDQYRKLNQDLRKVALVIILTRAGLGLDAEVLKKHYAAVLQLGLLPWIVECIAIAVTTRYLLGLPWIWGFLLGSMIASVSPAVVVPCLFRLRDVGYGVSKGIPTLVLAATAIDDSVSVAVFSIILNAMFSTGSMTWNIIKGPLSIIAGVVLGSLWGAMTSIIPEKGDVYVVPLRFLALFLGGLFSLFISSLIGWSGAGPLAIVCSGFIAAFYWEQQGWAINKNPVSNIFRILWIFFEPILFAFTGAQITANPEVLKMGAICLISCLVLRVIATFLVSFGCGLNNKEKLFIGLTWMAKATVQAALGPAALDLINSGQTSGAAVADETSYANALLTIQFSTIASLHGINMFSKCHNLTMVNTQVDNGTILWREYCKSVTLIGVTTGGLECDLDLLLSTVHNLMIFCIGKKELENLKNIDQIKRDLRQCYPILDYLLESLDPDAVISPHPTLVLDLIQSILCPQAQQLQIAFRAVTCKLLADVYILVVCGATPALSQIDEIVLQCWEGYAQLIKEAKLAYPRNFPTSVTFEPCVLGILLINIYNKPNASGPVNQ